MKLTIQFALFLITATTLAQYTDKINSVRYRRSSLHTILIETGHFPKKNIVINAYLNAPFPDKYDNHDIGEKIFNPLSFLEEERISDPGISKNENTYIMANIISSYFQKKRIANKLVAKWFDRKRDGTFDIELISNRGLLDASFTDIKTAKASNEGYALLKTAGFDLINNTFVVVSQLKFVENEIVARAARDVAIYAAQKNIESEIMRTIAIIAAEAIYNKTKEGYSVWTTSYLYKLKWDEVISNTFYTDMWVDDVNDPGLEEKKRKFDESDLFNLEYIGTESSSSLVTFSLSGKRTEKEIIELSLNRNIESVYVKLQKKYDVFKTKTPLYTGNPITAKIGLKEGLKGGDMFEVLEASQNNKTGAIEYKRKGTIKVKNNAIWDNRFKNDAVLPEETKNTSKIEATTFKGGKKYFPGMLIRQIK